MIYNKLTDFDYKGYFANIQYNADIIAQFDVVVSHSITANDNNYIRPKISDNSSSLQA